MHAEEARAAYMPGPGDGDGEAQWEEGGGEGERRKVVPWSVLGMEEYALFDAGCACWRPWWGASWVGGWLSLRVRKEEWSGRSGRI